MHVIHDDPRRTRDVEGTRNPMRRTRGEVMNWKEERRGWTDTCACFLSCKAHAATPPTATAPAAKTPRMLVGAAACVTIVRATPAAGGCANAARAQILAPTRNMAFKVSRQSESVMRTCIFLKERHAQSTFLRATLGGGTIKYRINHLFGLSLQATMSRWGHLLVLAVSATAAGTNRYAQPQSALRFEANVRLHELS